MSSDCPSSDLSARRRIREDPPFVISAAFAGRPSFVYNGLKLFTYFTGDGGHKEVMYRTWHTNLELLRFRVVIPAKYLSYKK